MIAALGLCTSFLSSPPKPTVTSFRYYGDTPPLNHFDPLAVNSGDVDESRIQWWREAELHHGRLAMLAAIALPLLEAAHPDSPSIAYLSALPPLAQTPFWAGMTCYEFCRMKVGFKAPNGGHAFSLLDDYQPGNVLEVDPDEVTEATYNRELNNGRLAMLACAHFFATGLL